MKFSSKNNRAWFERVIKIVLGIATCVAVLLMVNRPKGLPYPSDFILDKPLSGIVKLKCSVAELNDYILIVDLDKESKVSYTKNQSVIRT